MVLYFLHEHPAGATSWNTDIVKSVMRLPHVQRINSDMCAFGMYQSTQDGLRFVKKATGFMTNAPRIAEALSRECSNDHEHVHLMNGRAKRADKLNARVHGILVAAFDDDPEGVRIVWMP